MTPQDFQRTRKHLGLSQQALAEALDISRSSVELYERGSRRASKGEDSGRPVEIPKTVRLALAALCQGIQEFSGPE